MSTDTTTPVDVLSSRLALGACIAAYERFSPRSWSEARERAGRLRVLRWTQTEAEAGRLDHVAVTEIAAAYLGWPPLEGASTVGYGSRGAA